MQTNINILTGVKKVFVLYSSISFGKKLEMCMLLYVLICEEKKRKWRCSQFKAHHQSTKPILHIPKLKAKHLLLHGISKGFEPFSEISAHYPKYCSTLYCLYASMYGMIQFNLFIASLLFLEKKNITWLVNLEMDVYY